MNKISLDEFVEICLDAVLERYRRFQPHEKSKRSRESYQRRKLLNKTGKKGGKYVY